MMHYQSFANALGVKTNADAAVTPMPNTPDPQRWENVMKYSDFTVHVKPECGGAPDFLIERAVRDTAIDFCHRTDVYIPEPDSSPLLAV